MTGGGSVQTKWRGQGWARTEATFDGSEGKTAGADER